MSVPDFSNSLSPRSTVQVKQLQRVSRRLHVIPRDSQRRLYWVESATQPGRVYEVQLEAGALAGQCTCPWAQHGGINCKHVLAALRVHYAQDGALSFWRTRSEARRQHRRLVTGDHLYVTIRPRRPR